MSVQRQSSHEVAESATSAPENDLEITAELPVLDVAAYEAAAAQGRTGNTDTWIIPASALPDAVPEATPPREVEARLRRKGEIDKALAHADVERQRAAEERRALEEKLALRDRALAIVQQDLTTAQAVAASYLESLQSMEGRRGIFQEISSSLYWEVDERDVRIGRLEGELAIAIERARQLESRLNARTAEITRLEREVTGLGTKVTQSETERIRDLETAAAQHSAVLAERQSELDRTLAERTAQRKRAEQLEAELGAVRAELQQRSAALHDSSTERGEHMARIAAGDARVKELEGRIEEQHQFVRVLQADSNAAIARAKELEGDLRAAEDMINRLEADLRGRSARLDELEKTNIQFRTTVAEARAALSDRDSLIRRLEEETANSAVLLGAIQQRSDSTGPHEIAPEGDKRLLIRTDADSEVVHVLGRKTTVGRTPENDLQIDAKYISRHHAVILAGPAHTIIEDLNSTNGVLVNGRRITRQTLKDGDAVVIGKTVFRFAVRAVGERRG